MKRVLSAGKYVTYAKGWTTSNRPLLYIARESKQPVVYTAKHATGAKRGRNKLLVVKLSNFGSLCHPASRLLSVIRGIHSF